jgi:hypothetical protein
MGPPESATRQPENQEGGRRPSQKPPQPQRPPPPASRNAQSLQARPPHPKRPGRPWWQNCKHVARAAGLRERSTRYATNGPEFRDGPPVMFCYHLDLKGSPMIRESVWSARRTRKKRSSASTYSRLPNSDGRNGGCGVVRLALMSLWRRH